MWSNISKRCSTEILSPKPLPLLTLNAVDWQAPDHFSPLNHTTLTVNDFLACHLFLLPPVGLSVYRVLGFVPKPICAIVLIAVIMQCNQLIHKFQERKILKKERDFSENLSWCLPTVVLDKPLESSLVYREIKPVNPKGNQLWIFIVITDVEADTPILWPLNMKNWLVGKAPDAGKDLRQKEKRVA